MYYYTYLSSHDNSSWLVLDLQDHAPISITQFCQPVKLAVLELSMYNNPFLLHHKSVHFHFLFGGEFKLLNGLCQ